MGHRRRKEDTSLYEIGTDGKRYYVKQRFETYNAGSTQIETVSKEPKCTLYLSMLTSDAWANLTGGAIRLYHLMKMQAYSKNKNVGKRKRQDELVPHGTEFYFNKAMVQKVYPNATSSMRQFYKDRNCLIQNGFIKVVSPGTYNDKAIYDLSWDWQFVKRKEKRDTSAATRKGIEARRKKGLLKDCIKNDTTQNTYGCIKNDTSTGIEDDTSFILPFS